MNRAVSVAPLAESYLRSSIDPCTQYHRNDSGAAGGAHSFVLGERLTQLLQAELPAIQVTAAVMVHHGCELQQTLTEFLNLLAGCRQEGD